MHIFTPSPANHIRPRQFRGRGTAAARFLVGIALAGTAGAAQAASYTGTFPGGGTTTFTAAGLPAGGSTTADTLTFTTSGSGTAVGTDDIAAALNASVLTFSNTAALTLNQSAGTTIALGGATPIVNLNNTALVTDNLNLSLAASTAFNGNGSLAMGGAVSGAGFTLTKNGTGTLTFSGSGTSTLAALNPNAGTLAFGDATNAPTLNIGAGGGIGVYVGNAGGTGTFNMTNGTVNVTAGQGLVLAGTNTYAQTGGTFTTNGRIEFANNSTTGTSTVNVSGGALTTTAASGIETVRGTALITLSGTGTITTPLLDMTTTQITNGGTGNGPAKSTFNLDGGTLVTGQIIQGSNGVGAGNGGTFNFNGGTLRASTSAGNATFLQGLTNAFVKVGGAVIDTNGNSVAIAQSLLTDTTSTGGGLAKLGAGTLTLTGANTYTGANQIAAGTLAISSDGNLGAVPGSAFNDIQFTGTATLQDAANNVTLNANRNVSIANGVTATLDSGANVFQVGGAVSNVSGAAATTLALTGTGTGANTLSGTVSSTGAGGLILSKSGAGAWTFGGNGASTLAKGQLVVNAGTFNFASLATDTTSLALNGNAASGGNVGVYVKGGTFNMNGGTLTTNGTAQGLVVQGANTVYNQTGGLLNTTGSDFIEFANSGTTTQNISGGELKTAQRIELNTNGTSSTTTVSGTGLITTPSLVMLSNQTNNNTSTSTFNLGNGVAGGTLTTGFVGHGTSTGTGATTFNFNGGTLKSSASSTTFLQGLTAANVQAGGAVIDTNGFSDTIAQSLLAGTGGGLTKQGTGTLTLTGTNIYTGTTVVSAGTLALNSATPNSAVQGSSILISGDPGVGTSAASATNGVLSLSASNQIGNSTNVTLSGGTLALNGFSEGTTSGGSPTGQAGVTNTGSGAGKLTVATGSGISYFDFGLNNTGAKFTFSDYDFTNTGTLYIVNYNDGNFTGGVNVASGGGPDQLFFGSGQYAAQQLQNVYFVSPKGAGGTTYTGGIYQARLLSTGEVVAPEPSQWAALLVGGLGLGGLTLKARRRTA